MGTLSLAANYIETTGYVGFEYGHLQIVYEGFEIEVQAPYSGTTWEELGHFAYPVVRDHLDPNNTTGTSEDGKYSIVDIDLGDREAANVWDALVQIHNQFVTMSPNYLYGLGQNSNSYAATLLWMIGVDVNNYLAAVTPSLVEDGFPGASRNILTDGYNALGSVAFSLTINTNETDEFFRTGAGDDVFLGSAGSDVLVGGAHGDDIDSGDILTYLNYDGEIDLSFVGTGGPLGEFEYTVASLDPNNLWADRIVDFEKVGLTNKLDYFYVDDGILSSGLELVNAYGVNAPKDVTIKQYEGLAFDGYLSVGDVVDLCYLTVSPNETIRIQLDQFGPVPSYLHDGYIRAGADILEISEFDNVHGTSAHDEIGGSDLTNYLFGFDGNDVIVGREATDLIVGDAGDDLLYGGIWQGWDFANGFPVEQDETVYIDDGVTDYVYGGAGYDTYFASQFDQLIDASLSAVDDAAAAGSEFWYADGDGEVWFDGRLMGIGERVPVDNWLDYMPSPNLGIKVSEPHPTDPNIQVWIQQALFIFQEDGQEPIFYRVLNAVTLATDGTEVREYLLVVENPVQQTAISIAGVNYIGGDTFGGGRIEGLVSTEAAAAQTQQLMTSSDSDGGDTARKAFWPAIDADAFHEHLSQLDGSLVFQDGAAPVGGSGLVMVLDSIESVEVDASAAKNEVGNNLGSSREVEADLSTSNITYVSSVEVSAAAPAEGKGGGGGGKGGGKGDGDDPPPPVTTFLGIGIAEPSSTDTSGDDTLRGTKNDDVLIAGNGNDLLKGQGGNDLLEGGAGADVLDGGSGNDTASYESSFAGVEVNLTDGTGVGGHANGDTLADIENLSGSAWDDTFTGDNGDNIFTGNAGNDSFLSGHGGIDVYDGGLGRDGVAFLHVERLAGSVMVNLEAQTLGGIAEGSTMSSIEDAAGTENSGDVLIGSSEGNYLNGLGGSDSIAGGAGDDLLVGGLGSDTITGGAGADIFEFETFDDDRDTITDFTSGEDVFRFDLIDRYFVYVDDFGFFTTGFYGGPINFIGTDAFSGLAGEMRYEQENGDTNVYIDLTGNASQNFAIALNGLHTISESDFVFA